MSARARGSLVRPRFVRAIAQSWAERRAAVALLGVAGVVWLALAEWASLGAYARLDPSNVLGQAVHDAAPSAAYLAAGTIAMAARPASRIGIWLYLAGFLSLVGNFGNTQVSGIHQVGLGFTDMYQVPIGVMILTYPTGRFTDVRHRWLAIGAIAWLTVFGLLVMAYLDPSLCPAAAQCPANPFLVIRDPDVANAIYETGQVVGVALWACFAFFVFERWLRASAVSRRLLLPVWLAGILIAGGNVVSTVLSTMHAGGTTSLTWDYWINGTLLGTLLPVVFLAGLLRSTLARASIAAFVEEVGAGVSLGRLRESFARLVGDRNLQLAFPIGDGTFADSLGDAVELPPPAGGRVATPIGRAGETVAIVVHDAALEVDPALVRAAGVAAGLALENERLAAEVRGRLSAVRASRARLVEAADAERAKIERMLHDGAQQRLVALAIQLRVLGDGTEDLAVREQLAALGGELDDALAELRELARGIHPAVLVQSGLRSALESLAQRSPIPVLIDMPDGRYADSIEATAYYVAAEAVTNAIRYANASSLVISAKSVGASLELSVSDNGDGGADATAGSGLVGLEDRVAAVGGSMELTSAPGSGTVVHVVLPVTPRSDGDV